MKLQTLRHLAKASSASDASLSKTSFSQKKKIRALQHIAVRKDCIAISDVAYDVVWSQERLSDYKRTETTLSKETERTDDTVNESRMTIRDAAFRKRATDQEINGQSD